MAVGGENVMIRVPHGIESSLWGTVPVFLPGESQGWGRTESDTTEVT